MEYLNTEWTGSPLPVPVSDRLNLPGNWTDVQFDHDIADSYGHHSGSSQYLGNGGPGRFVCGKLALRLEDFAPGVEIQIRQYEIDADTGARVETHEPQELYTSAHPVPVDENGVPLYPARTHVHFHVWSYINTGHKLGVEVSQWPEELTYPTGHVAWAQFTGTFEA